MSLLLQHKILVGYFLLMAIIGSMAATLLHERNRVIGIESEMKHIHRVQHDVNTAHRYITLLAMRGETAIAWEKEDFEDYRSLRLRVDTMAANHAERQRGVCQPCANRHAPPFVGKQGRTLTPNHAAVP